jgi:hypothetical protein
MGDGCKVITRMLPGWVEEHEGGVRLIPDRAAAVKRIYQLAAAGRGVTSILRQLNDDKVPAFGDGVVRGGRTRAARGTAWSRPYVYRILSDRRAAGEFQPRLRDGTPDGDPIPDYYPRVVSDAEWEAARVAVAERRTGQAERRRNRPSRHGVNVFQGLLYNARDGDAYYCATKKEAGKPVWRRTLVTALSTSGKGPPWSFPYPAFEAAVLGMMGEIDPADVLPGNGKSELLAVKSGELARVDERLCQLAAALTDGDGEVQLLARAAGQLEGRKKELAAEVASLRREVAHPQAESWGEAQSLLGVLDDDPNPEDARLRLRAALRRIVDSVWLLVVPRGADRVAAVQAWFAGGEECRSYLVFYRPPRRSPSDRRESGWWAGSLPPALTRGCDLDLRDRRHADDLRAALEQIDLALLAEALAGPAQGG